MKEDVVIHWFRRDLRLHDNRALFHALSSGYKVVCIFIFDELILSDLKDLPTVLQYDRRMIFIRKSLNNINTQLKEYASSIHEFYGKPFEVWKKIIFSYSIKGVYFNHDYEPYAIKRDDTIRSLFAEHGIHTISYKDQCYFEKTEVVKKDGLPYSVFTPYKNAWLEKYQNLQKEKFPSQLLLGNMYKSIQEHITLKELGFLDEDISFPSTDIAPSLFQNYGNTRDYPSLDGTSKLGIHLRFGTISIRKLIYFVERFHISFLNELIWRDFYMMILANFPHIISKSFKPAYDQIQWINNEEHIQAWKAGKTGYPLVDAGMRELLETGHMHNRVRMVTASFLTKHLLVDWRIGEAWFAKHLIDYELSSNNGGWQWASGSGCDAAPYFRVFNPSLQQEKFDKSLSYIKKWIPEYGTTDYPKPIIEHEFARKRAIDTYKRYLSV